MASWKDAGAQFRNIKLGEATGRSAWGGASIAIDHRRPTNIVAASGLDEVYYSNDGGTTWKAEKMNNPGMGRPALLSDDRGNIYLFYSAGFHESVYGAGMREKQTIYLKVTDDGGQRWDEIGQIDAGFCSDHWPTMDRKGNLHIVWTENGATGEDSCQLNVRFATTRNGGKKWSEPVNLWQNSGDCEDGIEGVAGGMPAITHDGKVFVSWSNKETIFLDRSFDGGRFWLSNDIPVTEHRGGRSLHVPGFQYCESVPVLKIDKSASHFRGSLYLVWADHRNGNDDTDVWFVRSINYGDNWTPPMRINDDASRRHQFLPWMAVDEATGFIYIVYFDRRDHEDNQTDVYLAWSTNGGMTFNNTRVSESPFSPEGDAVVAYYNGIDAHKGIITPIWTRVDGNSFSTWTAIIRHEDLEKLKPKGK